MESIFPFNAPVTGRQFIGRDIEKNALTNLLLAGENVVIYDAPRTGKMSLVRQTLSQMKSSGNGFTAVSVSWQNTRTISDIILQMGSAILRSYAQTEDDYAALAEEFLSGTHLVFDRAAFDEKSSVLSLNWDIDGNDIKSVFSLPFRLSVAKGGPLYLTVDNFQNIMLTEDGPLACRLLSEAIRESPSGGCSLILLGSKLNAMKDIFERHGWFNRIVVKLPLQEISSNLVIDYAIKGFLTGGKVVDRDLMLGVCRLFRCNMWYINSFCFICDSLSKGYIMEPILEEALGHLLALHEPGFQAMMSDLTTFQVCLLRAIVDGHKKFSSSDILNRYNLSSSANVHRLKEALAKKEIVTFDENDEPHIIDPLFEYWVRKRFFGI